MKQWATWAIIGSLFGTSAWAQKPQIWTNPVSPPMAALDRLNLRAEWRTRIPVLGYRDGVATIQNLGDIIIVQAWDGSLTAFDPQTGGPRWYARFGRTFPITHKVGYNDALVLVANGTNVFALDRATGVQLWSVDLAASPSSPPTADQNAFYVCMNNGRLAAFAYPVETPPTGTTPTSTGGTSSSAGKQALPVTPPLSGVAGATKVGGPRATPNALQPSVSPIAARTSASHGPPAGTSTRAATVTAGMDTRSAATAMNASTTRTATGGHHINRTGRDAVVVNAPKLLWDFQTHMRITERPLISEKGIIVVGNGNEAIFIDKDGGHALSYKADSKFSAPISQFGDTVYAGCMNGSVYAFHLPSRTMVWQQAANGPITSQPMATDEDLFVTVDHGGIVRYHRANGQLVWQNPEAVKFLASNPKFVYALDRLGRLLVLDRQRGTTLTNLNVQGFLRNYANDKTDRIFLGANDGTLMSLHDRSYPTPVNMRSPAAPANAAITPPPVRPPAAQPPPDSDKPAEPDKDKP